MASVGSVGMQGFKLNYKGMGDLLKSGSVRSMLTSHAQSVASAAEADPHDDTFEYENSIHLEDETTDRAVVRVVADAPHALVVEANFGVLARALDSA